MRNLLPSAVDSGILQNLMRLARALLVLVVALVWMGGSDRPPVMVRFYLQASQSESPENVVPVTLANPPQVIYMRKHPEITEKDIASARMLPGGHVLLTFVPTVKAQLEALTRGNVGAILVVLVDGRVVYAPVIDVALTEGKFIIPENVSDQEVAAIDRFAKKLHRD